jgi:hypothetical protein
MGGAEFASSGRSDTLAQSRLCVHHGSVNSWMHTLSLPRYFLVTAIVVCAVEVGADIGLALLLPSHASWTRSGLAFPAISVLLLALTATLKERSHRRQ